MPTPRDRNLTDRFIDFMLGREPRGSERTLLEAAKPPLWVRFGFALLILGLIGVLVLKLFNDRLPWQPPFWPDSFLLSGVVFALLFAQREVWRLYGKRAQGEGRATQ